MKSNKTVSYVITGLFLCVLSAGVFTFAIMRKMLLKDVSLYRELSDKHFALFDLMSQWVKVKQNNKNLATWFDAKDYKRIAVYGMSSVAESLVNELKDSNIEILYGIERNPQEIISKFKVYSPEDRLPEADVIVVTAVYYYDDIVKSLSSKTNVPVVSLEDIVYET